MYLCSNWVRTRAPWPGPADPAGWQALRQARGVPGRQFGGGKLARDCEPAEEGPPDGFRVVAVRVVAGPGDPHEAHVRVRGRHVVAVGEGDDPAGRRVAADH